MDDARGCELGGEYSHRQVAHVFREMSENWKRIAVYHIGQVVAWCRKYLETVVTMFFVRKPSLHDYDRLEGYEGLHNGNMIAREFIARHIEKQLRDREQQALVELNQLDLERQEHPIIVDHEFEAESRRFRVDKEFRQIQAALNKYAALGGGEEGAKLARSINPTMVASTNGTFSQEDIPLKRSYSGRWLCTR